MLRVCKCGYMCPSAALCVNLHISVQLHSIINNLTCRQSLWAAFKWQLSIGGLRLCRSIKAAPCPLHPTWDCNSRVPASNAAPVRHVLGFGNSFFKQHLRASVCRWVCVFVFSKCVECDVLNWAPHCFLTLQLSHNLMEFFPVQWLTEDLCIE